MFLHEIFADCASGTARDSQAWKRSFEVRLACWQARGELATEPNADGGTAYSWRWL